jgi:hypothetical protein
MREDEKKAFWTMLQGVYEFYRKRSDLSDFSAQVWWNACKDYDFEQVSKAFSRHLVDADAGKFLPMPADLVRVLSGTTTDRAALAWGKVLEAMSSVGAYTDVVFDDPAIHAAIDDMGGWPKICRGETKDLSYLQHKFCEAHKAYVNRGSFEYPRVLIGDRSPDSDYEKKGLPVPKPSVVGEVDRARLVYKGGAIGGKTAIGKLSLADMVKTQLLENK